MSERPDAFDRLAFRSQFRSRAERVEAGKQLRESLPRSAHADWDRTAHRRDPVALLEKCNSDRIPELVPVRYGRMLRSPFTFLRGSAALMAADLSTLPSTGVVVQACGDCHILNFGLFATPERNLVFDINDFDETLPGPWEWDVKRLATSFAVAGRDQGLADEDCRNAAMECVRAYRERIREYSQMSPLEVWYARLDADRIIELSPDRETRERREALAERARERIVDHVFPKLVAQVAGRYRFLDQPPLLYHPDDPGSEERVQAGLEEYRATLPHERQVLLDRYRLEDYAVKAVGIGSVGTRCYVLLLFSEENHPLILQVKEAKASVLEPYAEKSQYENQGQRVVVGQRLIQSSSDIFLGWVRSQLGFDYYVRQLRDMKLTAPIEGVTATQVLLYAELCGWTLARAHAKSGDAATISGYLGKGTQFDEAIGTLAMALADQTEIDHAALVKAERTGRIAALVEEDQ